MEDADEDKAIYKAEDISTVRQAKVTVQQPEQICPRRKYYLILRNPETLNRFAALVKGARGKDKVRKCTKSIDAPFVNCSRARGGGVSEKLMPGTNDVGGDGRLGDT